MKRFLLHVELIPLEGAQFTRSQSVPKCDQDHCGVPVPASIPSCSFHQQIDLVRREIFTRSEIVIRLPNRNCPIFQCLAMSFSYGFNQGKLRSAEPQLS